MNENRFENHPNSPIEGNYPTPDEIEYLRNRYEESRLGGEREYFDLFFGAQPEKRFKIGPFFVAIVDNEEIHNLKGINVNSSFGWQSGGVTFILLSSRLSDEDMEKVLCHEMQEDLEWSKNLDVQGYGPHLAHEEVEKNPKSRDEILEELKGFQKNQKSSS